MTPRRPRRRKRHGGRGNVVACLLAAAVAALLPRGAAAVGFDDLCDGLCSTGMVLPVAPKHARLWGNSGLPGATITVVVTANVDGDPRLPAADRVVKGQQFTASGVADADGAWEVAFSDQPLPPIAKARLAVQARNGPREPIQYERIVNDVVAGQVWLCAGQVRLFR